jgi:hypothetical protein
METGRMETLKRASKGYKRTEELFDVECACQCILQIMHSLELIEDLGDPDDFTQIIDAITRDIEITNYWKCLYNEVKKT